MMHFIVWLTFTGCDSTETKSPQPHPEALCSSGTVPVQSPDNLFCIMAYEASLMENVAQSVAGVVPANNVSLNNAQHYCEAAGMRLVTYEEWRFAGSFTDAGTKYPWGDSAHSGQCILPYDGINWSTVQPAGSFEDCVSRFGVFDQLGNIWEWVDVNRQVDIDLWLRNRQDEGVQISLQDDALVLQDGTLDDYITFSVGFAFDGFLTDENDQLHVQSNQVIPDNLPLEGYIQPRMIQGIVEPGEMLPVQLEINTQDPTTAKVVVITERNGESIGAKVGGAYYTGADASLLNLFYGHVPTFDGTIGFRCAYDPSSVYE